MEQYDASVGCMYPRHDLPYTYITSVGCLFSSSFCLVFGDTTFKMAYRVPHAFICGNKELPSITRNYGRKSPRNMGRKFKDIYIGQIIQEKVKERGMTMADFAEKMNCARTTLYHIFNAKSIDIERLMKISDTLEYDFINEVYGKETVPKESTEISPPYLTLPINKQGVDISQLPPELIDDLKQKLGLAESSQQESTDL